MVSTRPHVVVGLEPGLGANHPRVACAPWAASGRVARHSDASSRRLRGRNLARDTALSAEAIVQLHGRSGPDALRPILSAFYLLPGQGYRRQRRRMRRTAACRFCRAASRWSPYE